VLNTSSLFDGFCEFERSLKERDLGAADRSIETFLLS